MNKIFSKKIHNWLGLVSAVFLLTLLITGVLLNHPDWMKDESFQALAADPLNPEHLLAARKEGLFRSLDHGQTWEEVNMLFPPQEAAAIQFAPLQPQNVYVLEKWGRIFFSANSGRVWQTLSLPFDAQAKGIELKQLSLGSKGQITLLTSHGYLISADAGATWDLSGFDPEHQPLRKLILLLHNGYFFGPQFVWLYDFSAVCLLLLIVTGFYLWRIGKK